MLYSTTMKSQYIKIIMYYENDDYRQRFGHTARCIHKFHINVNL